MLTVAIPTYNRAACLDQLLADVFAQLAEVPCSSISILVSDNASVDSTAAVVDGWIKRFRAQGAPLLYRRNEVNLGFSPNVDLAVSESPDEYVLIMGDDDGMEPGALSHAMELLRGGRWDMLFLDSVAYDASLNQAVGRKTRGDTCDFHADGLEYMMKNRCYPPALVSGCIFRKSLWRNLPASKFNYSICVHTLTAAALAGNHASIAVSHRACIKYRTGQPFAVWSSDPVYPFRFNLDSLRFCREERNSLGAGYGVLYDVSMRQFILNQLQYKLLKMSTDMAQVRFRLRSCRDWRRIYTWISWLVSLTPAWMLDLAVGQKVRSLAKGVCG